MHTPYPEMLPIDCVMQMKDILSNKQMTERKKEFWHCSWNVQGYSQRAFIGMPEEGFSAASPDVCCDSPDDACQELESLKCELDTLVDEGPVVGYGAEGDETPFEMDPATISLIITAVVHLIRWIKERRNK